MLLRDQMLAASDRSTERANKRAFVHFVHFQDARIVVVCGGHSKFPDRSVENLFYRNVDYVREIVMYCAEFNPHCHICVVTPPVSALVPMAVEVVSKTLKHENVISVVF